VPTLPLYSPIDARAGGAWPHASHHVTAPGGYEWWHLEAEDVDAGRLVVATLYDGYPFHPKYLRDHARYLRRPTRVAPAVPSQYPCVAFAVYEHGRRVAGFLRQYPPGSFVDAADTASGLRVGPNALKPDVAGALRLDFPGAAALSFVPSVAAAHPAVWRGRPPEGAGGGDHHWAIAAPGFGVTGTVVIPDGSRGGREVAFRGRGLQVHHYGTSPLGSGLRRWVQVRAVFGNAARVFLVTRPSDRTLPGERHLIVADGTGGRDLGVQEVATHAGVRAKWGLLYPSRVDVRGDAAGDGLRLTNGRVIDATPFSLRVAYDATDGLTGGRAVCDIIYPRRLRAPVFGRIVERSIGRGDHTR
jgi:hypothetical protein